VEKLRRELALLENMDARLWRIIVVCGGLTILALALAFLGIAILLHIHLGLAAAVAISLALAALFYFVSRYEDGLFWLFLTVFIGIILIVIFQEGASYIPLDSGVPDLRTKDGHKEMRRKKIKLAITKRKLRLEKILGH
jgi:hypothetical protein